MSMPTEYGKGKGKENGIGIGIDIDIDIGSGSGSGSGILMYGPGGTRTGGLVMPTPIDPCG
jgi:hypothetical protein